MSVCWPAGGPDPSDTIDSSFGGFGKNEGDNEITETTSPTATRPPAASSAPSRPSCSRTAGGGSTAQQQGDNSTYEVVPAIRDEQGTGKTDDNSNGKGKDGSRFMPSARAKEPGETVRTRGRRGVIRLGGQQRTTRQPRPREGPMGATENADRIREGYDAFNRADVAALTDLFADDIVWHFPGSSKLAGEHTGRDAALTALGGYGAASGGTLRANLIDLMASNDHVAGVANDTATSAGRTLDVRSTVVFAMQDGKVTEAWQYIDDIDALDAFLA